MHEITIPSGGVPVGTKGGLCHSWKVQRWAHYAVEQVLSRNSRRSKSEKFPLSSVLRRNWPYKGSWRKKRGCKLMILSHINKEDILRTYIGESFEHNESSLFGENIEEKSCISLSVILLTWDYEPSFVCFTIIIQLIFTLKIESLQYHEMLLA